MKWEEREIVVDIELVSLGPPRFERTWEPRIVPEEWCLYSCECGVTVGPELVVPHLESHGEEAPPERLAGMVQPASVARRGAGTSIEYEPHPNAGRRSELSGECEADAPREWCCGPEAGSAVYQCSECHHD